MKLEVNVTNNPSACFEVLVALSSMSATVFLSRRKDHAEQSREQDLDICDSASTTSRTSFGA
jgi:hypothetical protein